MISLIWGTEKAKQINVTKPKKSHRYREQTGGCQRGEGVCGGIGEGDWEIQTFSYKINESQVWNVQHEEYGQ